MSQWPVDSWPWPKIAVYVPIEPSWGKADELFPYFTAIARSGVRFLYHPAGRTDVVRNRVAAIFLEQTEYTHLLMLDSDMKHPADVVQRMARWVIQDPERDIVGALYFNRREPHHPQAWKRGEDGLYYQFADWEPGIIDGCDIVGTGCILIHRRVFEGTEFPWFAYTYDRARIDKTDFVWPTEDIYFCNLAREAGFSISVDTSFAPLHGTSRWIGEDDYRREMENIQDDENTIRIIE